MNESSSKARTIAVTSGKGGVGKTVLTANLAFALVQQGRRALIVDADFGLANLDIILNISPTATLHEVITGERSLEDVIVALPNGLHILPAASGMAQYTRMTSDLLDTLTGTLSTLSERYEYLFMDTGAGISDVVLQTTSLAQEVLVIATPEPTSITDAYAAIKLIAAQQNRSSLFLVSNQIPQESAGRQVAETLQHVMDRFLPQQLGHPVSLLYLGGVRSDPVVEKSICAQRLLLSYAPDTHAAQDVIQLAQTIQKTRLPQAVNLSGAGEKGKHNMAPH